MRIRSAAATPLMPRSISNRTSIRLTASSAIGEIIANVGRNGRLAVTFARPADYVSYQLKGRAAIIPVSAAHRQRAQHYIEAMTETFAGLGLDQTVAAPWLVDLEPQVLRLAVETIFVQTPGEKAGSILEPSR